MWHQGKESTCQCRRLRRRRFDPWVGKSPREEEIATHSKALVWRNPWKEAPGRQAIVHGVTKSQTGLSMCTRACVRAHTHTHTQYIHALERVSLSIKYKQTHTPNCFRIWLT